jgi:DUF1680 family protein
LLLCLTIVAVNLGLNQVRAAGKGITNTSKSPYVKLRSIDIDSVRWTDGFWADRIKWCQEIVIPNMWRLLQDPNVSHAYDNFSIAAGLRDGEHRGPKWHDGDFYKWLEAASFTYAVSRDEELNQLMDQIIEVIGKAQRKDGYIHTPVIISQRQQLSQIGEFENRLDFETYNMGHLMTCACIHYRSTGKDNLLSIAKKAADFLYKTYRDSPRNLANNAVCPSHYMGIIEMFRTCGDPRYLELAKGLIDIRDLVKEGSDHNQDRIPFRQQTQAVGHAVRANYLYAGVADVYAETGDNWLLQALEKIWQDVAHRKMYITGATGSLYDGASPDGSRSHPSIQLVHQAYGRPYQLPNITAYNESCAIAGLILWNWRMLMITGQACYADMLETAYYNGLLSTISLDGKKFFYTNPLRRVDELPFELRWSRRREPYINCFCCPPNTARTIAEISAYVYSISDEGLWINLYGSNVLNTHLADGSVLRLKQKTDYPWDGTINIILEDTPKKKFSLFLRIPGWAENAFAAINDEIVGKNLQSSQYYEIQRIWATEDRIKLVLPMPAQLMEAHPLVEETRNQTAIRRGPIVYCLESTDLPEDINISDVSIPPDIALHSRYNPELLGGIVALNGKARIHPAGNWDNTLYRSLSRGKNRRIDLRLIPYYAWDNRGESEMTVWVPLENSQANTAMFILNSDDFKHHIDFFNTMEPENIVNFIPNSGSWEWLVENIPFFECPDKNFEQIYYFRWWTFRKHLKKTADGFVFTEFLDTVGHSGKYNTISCALGHHIYEGTWLRDKNYIDDYARFWYLGNKGTLQPHFHKYSNWGTWALYRRYLVNQDKKFLIMLLDSFIADYELWEKEKGLANGLFWQYDVRDGMEESISGSRNIKNARPPLNSYICADAVAISKVAELAGKKNIAAEYSQKAEKLKSLIHGLLWDQQAKFFKVRHPNGELADVREEIGFIPWYFNIPVSGCASAWKQLVDPEGFAAPMGITTAERRHPQFRRHGVGTCEWDGAVWPYATSQTLVGMANLLQNYSQNFVSRDDYFHALMTYARSHQYRGKPYIGEYLDEIDGHWLKPDSDRSRYYNHSTFCDLAISGLVGLVPQEGNEVYINPLIPSDKWDWFCLDHVRYHGTDLTIMWDRHGTKYKKGKGLRVFADGIEIAYSEQITGFKCRLSK